MPDAFPAVAYHEDGRHTVVADADAMKALGKGWSNKHSDIHVEKIRAASGCIGEVVVPVQRTRMESI